MKNSNKINKGFCPVCGSANVGEYDICEVCNWENDPVQLKNPNLTGGANKMNLNQAKLAYQSGQSVY